MDPKKPSWLKDFLAQAAIVIFTSGLLTSTALLAVMIMYQKIPANSDDYLALLNDANGFCHTWFISLLALVVLSGASLGISFLLGWRVDINVFALHNLYANRLIRCYLGASRQKQARPGEHPGVRPNSKGAIRDPDPITGFDPGDDFQLSQLRKSPKTSQESTLSVEGGQDQPYNGPLLLINTALNLVSGAELAWQERKAESFVLAAKYCGCPTTGYSPTEDYARGLRLGDAMAISGAAVSPNSGYNSSTGATLLLTLFNARLGAWLGNPKKRKWKNTGPQIGLLYLLKEMFGRTDESDDYVYLSDGGHFEDLGVYELIRRRCRYVILCDAGADSKFVLEDLGNLIRKVRIDFGVRIEIDVSCLRARSDGKAASHVAFGKILYSDVDGQASKVDNPWELGPREGLLIYIKPVLTGDEPADLENYAAQHPTFPNDTTLNQFFTESQFESYRALGYHSTKSVFGGWDPNSEQLSNHELFTDVLATKSPAPPDFTHSYLTSNQEYVAIQKSLENEWLLSNLSSQLGCPSSPDIPRTTNVVRAEYHMTLRMMTVLENVWLGLKLDRYCQHPIHSRWMGVFRTWVNAPIVKSHWETIKPQFSRAFQEFIKKIQMEPNPK